MFSPKKVGSVLHQLRKNDKCPKSLFWSQSEVARGAVSRPWDVVASRFTCVYCVGVVTMAETPIDVDSCVSCLSPNRGGMKNKKHPLLCDGRSKLVTRESLVKAKTT